ncbi:MAG: MFS transporter [Patescibacteria group bacterium]
MHMFAIGMCSTGYVPFLQSLGLSLADIPLINIFFMGTIFLMEIPTGMLADGRSRGWSVKVGIGIWALSTFAYALAQGFWTVLISEALGGLGNAFISGAFVAWLTDALKNRGEGKKLQKILVTTSVSQTVCCLAAGFIGSWIWMISPRLGWCVCGVMMLITLAVTYRYLDERGEPLNRISEIQALKLTILGLKNNPWLRWSGAVCAISGLVFAFNYYWSPFYIECFGRNRIGLIWILIYGTVAVSGLLLRFRAIRFAGPVNGIVLSLIVTGLGLAFAGYLGCTVWSIAFAMIHEFGRGLFRPLADTFFQKQFQSENRATAGSAQSFIQTLAWSLILLVAWYLMRDMPDGSHSISMAWIVSGVLLVILSTLLWLLRPKKK